MRWRACAALLYPALLSLCCPPSEAQQPRVAAPKALPSAVFDGTCPGNACHAAAGRGLASLYEKGPIRSIEGARAVSRSRLSALAVSGRELLLAAHELARQNHSPLSYKGAKTAMFSYTDNVEWDGTRGVVAVYSWVFVPGASGKGGSYHEEGDLNGDGYIDAQGMNAEHVWPQSFFKERLPMRADLHNLMPAFMHPNSMRGRLPFAEVSAADADYATGAGARRGPHGFEPPDQVKGRVSRAMLYFYCRYLGYNVLPSAFVESFWNSRIELLLRWNREFPPDDWERRRNNAVAQVQGNRNPFVDDPGLADRIGAEAFSMPRTSSLYASAALHPRAPRPGGRGISGRSRH